MTNLQKPTDTRNAAYCDATGIDDLEPLESGWRCWHRVGRGRCYRRRCDGELPGGRERYIELADHAMLWRSASLGVVMTTEPYNFDQPAGFKLPPWQPRPGGTLEEAQQWATEHGLTVERREASPWAPGSTTLLVWRRALKGSERE